ncbi:hypothetical protein BT69DRAFT_1266106 [Atractiella rhizophila]|nr:hypothetical protein BT69DRAFT_1266106 [Atractiella rhizophila]
MSTKNKQNLSLPQFLKLLTAKGDLSMSKAMSLASKLIPAKFDSEEKLSAITPNDLLQLGISNEEDQKGVMKAGGQKWGMGNRRKQISTADKPSNQPKKRKRDQGFSRDVDLDRPLPNSAPSRHSEIRTSLDFNEILDETILQTQSVVVNRAPVMTAWATVVAERLGFNREEALSIAHAYTEMNATSKATYLGISPKKTDSEIIVEKIPDSQPVVELMGRKVPVLSLQSEEWRAIVKGTLVEPAAGFGYIQRSFRQQMGVVLGSLRLLAMSIDPSRLNEIGYGLYLDFRPQQEGWGKRSELKMASILELREHIKATDRASRDGKPSSGDDAPPAKRVKVEGAASSSSSTIVRNEVKEGPSASLQCSTLKEEGDNENDWGDLNDDDLAEIDC